MSAIPDPLWESAVAEQKSIAQMQCRAERLDLVKVMLAAGWEKPPQAQANNSMAPDNVVHRFRDFDAVRAENLVCQADAILARLDA